MEKMKQNKYNSVIIRVASATLAAVFLFCSLAIPSFADTVTYADSKLPYLNYNAPFNQSIYDESLSIFTSSGRSFAAFTKTIDVDVYSFVYYVEGGQNPYVYYLSESEFYVSQITKNGTSFGSDTGTASYYSNYELYIKSIEANPFGSNYVFNVPVYDSSNAGITAFKEFLANGGGSDSGTVAEFNYSIKPGYALFIDIHGLSDVSGTLFTNTSAAYASPHTSNQTLSYQSSLPSGNVSPQGNGINWQGTGNRDLFGRYKSWNRSLIIQPNANYIAIYNPVHINTYVDPEHEDFNGNISVHVNKAYSETSILIPLNTELTGTGTVGTNTTDEQKPVVYDENTNSWIPQNSDGTPYTESPYGDYMPSTVNSIHDWLQNIANLISGFFNGAIGAVTTLVGAGSAFINQLVSLYSWLPAPVYAVLSSALILVITIGVIKVFI